MRQYLIPFIERYVLFESISNQINMVPLDKRPSFIIFFYKSCYLSKDNIFGELISINHDFNQYLNLLRTIIQKYHFLDQGTLSSLSGFSSLNILTNLL